MIKIFTTITLTFCAIFLNAQEYRQVKNFTPGTPSSKEFRMFGVINGDLVFKLFNDEENDEEFWVTDGTEDGTTFLTGYGSNFPSTRQQSVASDNALYFYANGDIHRYDGSYSVVANDVSAYRLNIFQDELYFLDNESSFNTCLSKITANPDEQTCIFELGDILMTGITTYDNQIITIGEVSNNVPGLFKSDGTETGTESFFDFVKDGGANRYVHFMENDGLLYFYQEESSVSSTVTPDLYVTDGTQAGTQKIGETHPGNIFFDPEPLSVFNNNVLYTSGTAANNEFALELWVSDGTVGGTQFVKDLNEDMSSSDPKNFVSFGNFAYFTAEAPDGKRKIWRTDGTEAGTEIIFDNLFTGDYGSWLTVYDGQLAFGASSVDEGSELWFSDGTEVGTVAITDESQAGENLFFQGALYAADNLLYFAGFTEENGRELWVYDNGVVGTNEINNDLYNITTAPNPFSESIIFSIDNLDNTKTYQLQVIDAAGKMVERIAIPTSGQLEWRGDSCPNGILFYHLMEKETGNVIATGRIIKL